MSTSLIVNTNAIPKTTNPDVYPKAIQLAGDVFSYNLNYNVQTLAQGSNPQNPINGWLYVPTLQDGDPCIEQTSRWVPENVTRKSDLPPLPDMAPTELVAIAPWLRGSSECALAYVNAAEKDNAAGLLFFLSGNSSAAPPDSGQKIWYQGRNANDESDEWKQYVDYSVFAIPSDVGNLLMAASAQYSGNVSQVPSGDAIAKQYPDTEYVRLSMEIEIGVPSNLPSLWILLLVVLAIVMTLMGLTSLSLHWLQLRRRKDLRRRVENGEVDLEALGIKRLTVPQEVLDDMPLYTYGSGDAANLNTNTSSTETKADNTTDKATEPVKFSRPTSPLRTNTNSSWPAPYITPSIAETIRSPSHIPTSLLQPTCPICLEEFIPENPHTNPKTPGTTVRELPCQHIFHPECVDTFLRDSSSLCPMCKTAALPKGYCPKMITNAMVRRERLVRRRGTVAVLREGDPYAGNVSPLRRSRVVSWGASVSMLNPYEGRRMTTPRATVPRIFRSPSQSQVQTAVEMTSQVPRAALTRSPSSPAVISDIAEEGGTGETVVQPSSNPRRREWARQRAVAMLGRRDAPVDPDAEESGSMPRWRKGFMRIFPGLGAR